MLLTIAIVNGDPAADQFRAFAVLVYCKRDDLEEAQRNAVHAAANAHGVIAADGPHGVRTLVGSELEWIDEIVS